MKLLASSRTRFWRLTLADAVFQGKSDSKKHMRCYFFIQNKEANQLKHVSKINGRFVLSQVLYGKILQENTRHCMRSHYTFVNLDTHI